MGLGTKASHMKDAEKRRALVKSGGISYKGYPMNKDIAPYKYLIVYKKDKDGNYILKNVKSVKGGGTKKYNGKGTLVIDRTKSKWIPNPTFGKVTGFSAKRYVVPKVVPSSKDDTRTYNEFCWLSLTAKEKAHKIEVSRQNRIEKVKRANRLNTSW